MTRGERRERLRTVLDDWVTVETDVYAVYPSRRHVVAKLRAFLDFLVAEFSSVSQPQP
ncbi:hypothetical protein [Fodinicurvata fenggangensis]|uniref:hypothetical protein n=1 Tax=Fodinicurvata fenggangensis TaxID=1121830 RepID=UPI001B80D61B|nr:hypothetical protein [Fodinicurvata fenggangensis]